MQHWKRPLIAITLVSLTTGLGLPALAEPGTPAPTPILISAPAHTGWDGHWAESDMQRLIEEAVITIRKALPAPDSPLSMGDAAQLLIQLQAKPVPDGDAVSAAVAVGLINPEELGLTQFTEETAITREVFALWLCRATGRQMLAENAKWLLHPEFTDAGQISPRFNNAVGLLQMHQIIAGNPDGSFAPQQAITAAEAYRMISQALVHPLEP